MKENIEFIPGIESIIAKRPSLLLWLIPSSIGFFIVILVIWLTLSEIDVIVPSQGKIITSSQMIPIQTKELSSIEKIYVKNGQNVKEGELLISFKKDLEHFEYQQVKAQYDNLNVEKGLLEGFIQCIDQKFSNQLNKNNSQILNSYISSYKSDIKTYGSKLKRLEDEIGIAYLEVEKLSKKLSFTQEKVDQLLPLVKKGLKSDNSLRDMEVEYLSIEKDMQIKKLQAQKLQSERIITKNEMQQYTNNILKEHRQKLYDIEKELKILKPQVDKMNYLLKSQLVYAPVDGMIHNLREYLSNKVVQSGNTIMELIPTDSPLEVEAKVLNQDIGFISVGQKVKVKIDSFKFTKYGYIEGIITHIEHASIKDEQLGEIYPITVELQSDTMKIDNRLIRLIPGMTCTVDIKLSKRKLIEYIISPMIRYKDEALKER